jgi:hypothetical protein
MRFFMAALIFALLAAQVVPARSQRASNRSGIPAEEYAIYAAVIDEMFASAKVSSDSQSEGKLLIIEDRTVKNTFVAILGKDEGKMVKQAFSPTISQDTIDDYLAKNAKSHRLTKSFGLKLEYTLIPEEKIESILESVALSRAGLNSSGNQALVYMQRSCGPLCGGGHYMLLVKNKRRWVVKEKFTSWVS